MSHTTTINTVPIKDVSALRDAVHRLKNRRGVSCTLEENAKPRMYYRHQEEPCEYVLRLHNSNYDVGFKKQPDGSYTAIFDEWADYVGKELAVKTCPAPNSQEEKSLRAIGMFTQEYNRCTAVAAAAASGYYVENETIDAEGRYQMEFAEA